MAATQEVGRIFRDIIRRVKGSVNDKNLKALGEYAVGEVRKRTRLGYGVRRSGAPRHRLKPLSTTYVKWRQENRRDLSEYTSTGKSNLTLTGQMLDSLNVVKANFGVVTIGPTGRRKGKHGGGLRNTTIAIANERQGRFFNYLTDLEIKKVARFYERQLQAKLK